MIETALRVLCVDMIENAKSGHPGLPLGMADVISVLFKEVLVFDPKNPNWENRDRFVLSAGHGSALLYAALYLTGYESPTIEDLKNFRTLNSPTAGHPEFGHLKGIETTTGPLGQGVGNAVGMAMAQKILKNDAPHIYCLCSDGDIMEGVAYEAMSIAGHFELSNLTFIFDDNEITIDGSTNLIRSTDLTKFFESMKFKVIEIDGHDKNQILSAFKEKSDLPKIIRTKTKIGFGSPNKQGTSSCHGSPLGEKEASLLKKNLNWNHPPFHIPDEILSEWRKAHGNRYLNRKADTCHKSVSNWEIKLEEFKKELLKAKPALATRQLFQKALEVVEPYHELLVGGSADLTASNNTKVKTQTDFPDGRYINYGIREHAMGSIMNGLSLSGLVPYGGTFLVFSDYLRPSIRLSALMKQGVIYVFTHDSIALGEDGPTHQPIEHLASLRAIPDLLVLRPCDGMEVAECLEIALKTRNRPSALILTRQEVPFLRTCCNQLAKMGGYVIHENENAKCTLIATGSEVGLAFEVNEILGGDTRIVSIPCFELFKEQSDEYQETVLGNKLRIGIEFGVRMCWDDILNGGKFFGLSSFGASGKAKEVINHFGLSAKDIAKEIEKII